MKYFRIVFALSVIAVANAGDLDSAVWMFKCAKYALTNGCADAKIPSHNPLRINKTLENIFKYEGVSYSIKLENITWAGISNWVTNVSQNSADGDAVATFKYLISWPSFVLNADYEANVTEPALKENFKGQVKLVLNDLYWTGILSVTKPSTSTPANFAPIDLTWRVHEVKADISGARYIGNTLATAMGRLLKTMFDTQSAKTPVENIVTNILNNKWAKDGARVQKLIDYCKNSGL